MQGLDSLDSMPPGMQGLAARRTVSRCTTEYAGLGLSVADSAACDQLKVFRQRCIYLDKHSVLKGMGNLVPRKGDMRVAMQLPAAHMDAVACQLDAKPAPPLCQASTCPGLAEGCLQGPANLEADGVNTLLANRAWSGHASSAAHILTALPTVWSSRWMMKVAACSTLVSFTCSILQSRNCC